MLEPAPLRSTSRSRIDQQLAADLVALYFFKETEGETR
jgi:hypothetical protein